MVKVERGLMGRINNPQKREPTEVRYNILDGIVYGVSMGDIWKSPKNRNGDIFVCRYVGPHRYVRKDELQRKAENSVMSRKAHESTLVHNCFNQIIDKVFSDHAGMVLDFDRSTAYDAAKYCVGYYDCTLRDLISPVSINDVMARVSFCIR